MSEPTACCQRPIVVTKSRGHDGFSCPGCGHPVHLSTVLHELRDTRTRLAAAEQSRDAELAEGSRMRGAVERLRARLAEVEAERRAVVERVRETLLATRVLVDDDDVWHADTEEAMDALLGRRCRVLRALSALDAQEET